MRIGFTIWFRFFKQLVAPSKHLVAHPRFQSPTEGNMKKNSNGKSQDDGEDRGDNRVGERFHRSEVTLQWQMEASLARHPHGGNVPKDSNLKFGRGSDYDCETLCNRAR